MQSKSNLEPQPKPLHISYTVHNLPMQALKTKTIALLRWSEKYTKTDMVHLASGGFWLLLSQTLVFLLSFALLWVFANFTSPETYGLYRFLITVVAILSIATLPGMRTALVRSVALHQSGIASKMIRYRIRWGLFGTLGGFLVATYYFIQQDTTLGSLFLIVALFIPFLESYALFDSYFNGKKDYIGFTISSFLRRSVITVSTAASIFLTGDIFVILITYLASTAISNFLIWHYTLSKFPLDKEVDEEAIPYGKKLSLLSVAATISDQLDKIILWYITGPIQVAIYTITIALPKEIYGALSQIGILALPKMAARNQEELRQSLLRKVLIFLVATIPIVVLYVIFAPLIFEIFLPQYLDYVSYSQIGSLILLLSPITLLSQYFMATMNTRALYTIQFTIPVVQTILFIILIPIFGVVGAIWALIARYVVSLILFVFLFKTEAHSTAKSA